MKKKTVKVIVYITFPLLICAGIFIVFLLPARVYTTTSVSDYLIFHEPVKAYLHMKDYFLPDYSVVAKRNGINYTYAYKEEGWGMDQFCIHLTMTKVDMGMVNGYIKNMKQLGSIRVYLKEGQEVWFTKETGESMKERLNLEIYDGMPLFFFIMVCDDCRNTVEFYVCKIEDAGEIVFPELTSILSVIAPDD